MSVEGDGEGDYLLSVIAKRTYAIAPGGECVVAPEQLPLSDGIVLSTTVPDLIEQDTDLIARKPRTDVIVRGHAYPPPGEAAAGVTASVRIGRHRKDILAVGRRRLTLSATGGLVISAAEPFERIPLTFAHAYGGRDRAAEARYGNPFAPLARHLAGNDLRAENMSPYLYPRNPCGKGYLVEATPEAVAECELPNLEDPQDLLTPDRLLVGHPGSWIYMPMPQALGWVSWGWFPRAGFAGLVPQHRQEARPIPEVARGLLPREVLMAARDQSRPGQSPWGETPQTRPSPEHLLRFGNGAPLDLQLPFLTGDETIELTHLRRDQRDFVIRLPGKPPRICTDGREGKLDETTPVLQTVLIEPDEGRLSLVWRGSARARRPYLPQELLEMPLLVAW